MLVTRGLGRNKSVKQVMPTAGLGRTLSPDSSGKNYIVWKRRKRQFRAN